MHHGQIGNNSKSVWNFHFHQQKAASNAFECFSQLFVLYMLILFVCSIYLFYQPAESFFFNFGSNAR